MGKDKKNIWVREYPESPFLITANNAPFEVIDNEKDYDFQDRFNLWFSERYGKTAVIIGIRAAESLNRYRAIKSDNKVNIYKKTIIFYRKTRTQLKRIRYMIGRQRMCGYIMRNFKKI